MNRIKQLYTPISQKRYLLLFLGVTASYFAIHFSMMSVRTSMIVDAIYAWNMEKVYYIVGIFGGMSVIFYLNFYWDRRLLNTAKTEYRQLLYEYILPRLLYMKNTTYESLWTWKILTKLNTWVQAWIELFSNFYVKGIDIVWRILFQIGIVFATWAWQLWTLLVFSLILYGYIAYIWEKKIVIFKKQRNELEQSRGKRLVMICMNKLSILSHNMLWYELDTLASYISPIQHVFQKQITATIKYNQVWRFFADLVKIFVFLRWAQAAISGTISVGDFVLYTMVVFYFTRGVLDITKLIYDIGEAYTSIEILQEVLQKPQLHSIGIWNKFIPTNNSTISIHNLTFGYWTSHNIFQNFSLEIKWGQTTALVGSSGAGKTTLVKIIAWYIQEYTWTIRIWEQILDTIALESYYKHIGFVMQETLLFDWTIKDNLIYWLGNIDKKMLHSCITKAQCHFIYDLPHGIQTHIGEKWIKLSWGQRQRIAIAKIMLKNPSIVFLDEPTSSLDSFSEDAITKALQELYKGRTIVIIAHRLQTVKHADTIVYLDNGKIIEQWTHNQLVNLKWKYASMVEVQTWF